MPPLKFGRYEVVGEIGEGAMGRVYRAFDPVVGRTVAVKTVKSEYLTKETAPEYMKRFRREAQAAGVLTHPNIVSIFDVGDGFLVMEFLEGKSLDKIVAEEGKVDPAEALKILTPVAEALDHAHKAGVFHRDIKPANIMVLSDGRPKLMDFGVAHLEASLMTTTGQVLGSPSYMAPEQIAGTDLTARADVYSLAVVAYEMLTGQRPFQGASITSIIYRVMTEQAPPPRKWNSTLPPHYDDVFQRALAKDPSQRFPSATAFVAALDIKEFEATLATALLGEAAPPAPNLASPGAPPEPAPAAGPTPKPAGEEVGRRSSKRAWPWIAAGAAAVVAVAVGLAALLRRAPAPPSVPVQSPPGAAAATTPASPGEVAPAAKAAAAPAPARGPSSAAARVEPPTAPPAGASKARPKPTLATKPPSSRPATAAAPTPKRTRALAEGTLVDMGPGVIPPRRISGSPAPYPPQAQRLKLYGSVTVSMIVNAKGEPTEVQVVESAGRLLDEAVLRAVRDWRFEPATKGGVKVSVRWMVRQRFERGS